MSASVYMLCVRPTKLTIITIQHKETIHYRHDFVNEVYGLDQA